MTTTEIVMALTVVILLTYDVFAVLKWGVNQTISHVMLELSRQFPLIPFLLGGLMGHFFWLNP